MTKTPFPSILFKITDCYGPFILLDVEQPMQLIQGC
jgi:hypothetical protein